jgi:exopolysaccharide biosynthesis operon protein EpsL
VLDARGFTKVTTMKKRSIRPLLTVSAACLLPAVLHAQTTLQSPGGQLGESAAQPAGQPMATPMGPSMVVPMSPAASISQPFPPVTTNSLDGDRLGLQFRARAGIERDDNVTRVSGPKVSDTITTLGVGLRYNQRFSQQRVVVDLDLARVDYDKQALKYNQFNYAAAWFFRYGNQIDGVASAERRQFRDVTNGTAGVISRRTERNEVIEGGYRLGAAYKVTAGLLHNSSTSTDLNSWDGNPDVNSVRIGALYDLASGSNAGLRYRHGEGKYQTGIVPDFKDDELEALAHWQATVKTSVDGRLAHIRREHSGGAGARDFSGMVGSLAANWEVTAKTRVIVGYARDMGSYLFGTAGHTSSDRIYIAPVWRPTVQTAVSVRYENENRKWDDVTGPDAGRRDKFNVLALGFDWQVLRTVGLQAQWRNERRSSSLPAFDYRANVIGLSAKLTI